MPNACLLNYTWRQKVLGKDTDAVVMVHCRLHWCVSECVCVCGVANKNACLPFQGSLKKKTHENSFAQTKPHATNKFSLTLNNCNKKGSSVFNAKGKIWFPVRVLRLCKGVLDNNSASNHHRSRDHAAGGARQDTGLETLQFLARSRVLALGNLLNLAT